MDITGRVDAIQAVAQIKRKFVLENMGHKENENMTPKQMEQIFWDYIIEYFEVTLVSNHEYRLIAEEKARSAKLVEALKKVSAINKNDGNAPKDNRGPSSMAYWAWQEEQSRDIAGKALAEYNGEDKDE